MPRELGGSRVDLGQIRTSAAFEVGFQSIDAYMEVMDLSAAPAISHLMSVGRDPDERVAAIYAAHYQQLVGLATMLGGGRAIGEEIAQEAFVIALRRERREPGYLTEPVWPWLRITAARLAGRSRQRLLRADLPSTRPTSKTRLRSRGSLTHSRGSRRVQS